MKTNPFDIVIPMYNASERIEHLLDELAILFQSMTFRLILVDDFSKDNTVQKIKEIQANYPFEMELIRLSKNEGQHNATMIGLSFVKNEFVITLDDDLQHHPDQIPTLIQAYQQSDADLIYGAYHVKKHSLIRNIGSAVLKFIVKLSNPKLVNITSFRLVKKDVLKPFENNFKPIILLDEYLINQAASVEKITIEHHKSNGNSSTYSYRKLINFAINIILFHSAFPLRFITRLGLYMSLIFTVIGCYFIWQKFFQDVQIGFTSIIVSIFFSSGLILFALGIIGEYIRKIWVSQSQLNTILIRSHDVFER